MLSPSTTSPTANFQPLSSVTMPSSATGSHAQSSHSSPHQSVTSQQHQNFVTPSVSHNSQSSSHHQLPPGSILNPLPITTLSPSPSRHQTASIESHHSSQTASSTSVGGHPLPYATPHRIHPHNTHSMATRGKHGIVQKRIQPTLLLTHIEPTSHKQAMQSPEWLKAIQAEYDALLNNHTWTLVSLPAHRQAVGCKWVFRVKQNPDGSINKYKARLCGQRISPTAWF